MSLDSLDAAVGEAAAALTFADAIRVAEPPAEAHTRYAIDLLEPAHGRLVLRLSPADAQLLAQAAWGAFYGQFDAPDDQFLFELLNIVAGRWLAMECPDQPIRLGFPQRLDDDAPWTGTETATYDLNGSIVSFGIEREGGSGH